MVNKEENVLKQKTPSPTMKTEKIDPEVSKKDITVSAIKDAVSRVNPEELEAVLVVGIRPDGVLTFSTNVPRFDFMQWMLSKASFELHIHEKSPKQEG